MWLTSACGGFGWQSKINTWTVAPALSTDSVIQAGACLIPGPSFPLRFLETMVLSKTVDGTRANPPLAFPGLAKCICSNCSGLVGTVGRPPLSYPLHYSRAGMSAEGPSRRAVFFYIGCLKASVRAEMRRVANLSCKTSPCTLQVVRHVKTFPFRQAGEWRKVSFRRQCVPILDVVPGKNSKSQKCSAGTASEHCSGKNPSCARDDHQ